MFGELGIFDYIIISITVLSLLTGFFKGFIATVLSLFRLILSFISATLFSSYTLLLIINKVPNKDIAEYISFTATFLISYLLISIIKYYITSLFSQIHNGAVDRMFGAVFGLIRGIIISCFIFIGILGVTGALNVVHSSDVMQIKFEVRRDLEPKWIESSALQPKLTDFSKLVISLMPENWWHKIESYVVTKKSHVNENTENDAELFDKLIKDGGKRKEINNILDDLKKNLDTDKLNSFREMLNKDDINQNFSYDEFKKIMKTLDQLESQIKQEN